MSPSAAVECALRLLEEGADVVEVGGESTRPGAQPVSAGVESDRILPVIEGIVGARPGSRIAVDTVKGAVARAALQAGATIVNDVSALRLDATVASAAAEHDATLVLMHSRGGVSEMARYDHAVYADGVMAAIVRELREAAATALDVGLPHGRVVLDPGIGFSKRGADSLAALAHLPQLVELGFPVMVGASRKRFIGEITGVQRAAERDAGTIGAHVVALALGASWIRAHEVRMHRQALDVAVAILGARG